MSRRLKTIAEWINTNMPGYDAKITRGFCNTDRKIAGCRYVIRGKGREGNRLKVCKDGVEVLDHNSAETYRCNNDVEHWLLMELKALERESHE